MKKEQLQRSTLKELEGALKQQKILLGLLIGLGVFLLAVGCYDYFNGRLDRNFWSTIVIGLCALAMVPHTRADIKLINTEIARRKE